MKRIIKDQYDSDTVAMQFGSYKDNQYGFDGYFQNKKGMVDVCLTQDSRRNYYLILNTIFKGRDYRRQFELKEIITHKQASRQARIFLDDVHKT